MGPLFQVASNQAVHLSPPHFQTLFLLANSRAADDGAGLVGTAGGALDGHTAGAGGGCVSLAVRLMLDHGLLY